MVNTKIPRAGKKNIWCGVSTTPVTLEIFPPEVDELE
jgi:hypothetical protein